MLRIPQTKMAGFALAGVLSFLAVGSAYFKLTSASPVELSIVSQNGRRLASIYSDLSVSRYFIAHRYDKFPTHDQGCKLSRVSLQLGSNLLFQPVQGCPADTSCAGHYTYLESFSGCLNEYGYQCYEFNFREDFGNATYEDGEFDTYDPSCGCCWSAAICENDGF